MALTGLGRNDSCLASGARAGQQDAERRLILPTGSRESNPPAPTLAGPAGPAGPVAKAQALGTQGAEGSGVGEQERTELPGTPWSHPHPRTRA